MGGTTINTTCLCGASQFAFALESSKLPLTAHLCHCDVSRRISGTICTSYVSTAEFSSLHPDKCKETMTAYRSSEAYNRWFCTACGTHMVFEHIETGEIHLATGTIEAESTDSIVDFKGHMWLEYSKDGGASEFIRTINDKPAERWAVEPGESQQVSQAWRSGDSNTAKEADMDSIPLHCHCKRVQLRVTRPTAESQDIKTKQGVCWWLSEDRKRFLAGTCTCRSCRLGTGFDIMSWSFIPLINLEFPDGSAIQGTDDGLEADEKVARMFSVFDSKTAEGVKRYFCPDCGASVIWFSPTRPKLLDVASALLDAPSGVRAETFLEWFTARVSYSAEALHKGLLAGLETGLKEWWDEKNKSKTSQDSSWVS